MGTTTEIAWTDSTFNPWMGCTKVSPGCDHCYACTLVTGRMNLKLWGPKASRQVTSDANWRKPLQWNAKAEREGRRHRVFCASLCDVFEDHPTANATRPRLWDLIRKTPNLDWQLLTKRPELIQVTLPSDWSEMAYPNVWLGTTVESNEYIWRLDFLCDVPAVCRFVSYEPALGPLPDINLDGIDWLIYGGESGLKFRPHDPQWARDIRDRCNAEGVAFFYKQSPGVRTGTDPFLDGVSIKEWPVVNRVL